MMYVLHTTILSKVYVRKIAGVEYCVKYHIGEGQKLNCVIECVNIAILQKIPHPNIVTYSIMFDALQHPLPYIMSPKYDTTVLKLRVHNTQVIKQFVEQIGPAIAHLHSHHMLHRDIKPDNIFVRRAPSHCEANPIYEFFLGDFGAAKVMYDDQLNTDDRTTIAFTAPEYLQTRIYTRETDIWAFGATIFYMQHERVFKNDKFRDFATLIPYLISTCAFDQADVDEFIATYSPIGEQAERTLERRSSTSSNKSNSSTASSSSVSGQHAINRYMNLTPHRRRQGVFAIDQSTADRLIAPITRPMVEDALQKATAGDADHFISVYFDWPRKKDDARLGLLAELVV